MQDEDYIKKCLELAKKGKGYTSPNPLDGCVIVKNGEIISEGYHHKSGDKHAEIDALDKLKNEARKFLNSPSGKNTVFKENFAVIKEHITEQGRPAE